MMDLKVNVDPNELAQDRFKQRAQVLVVLSIQVLLLQS